jgi:hypothetical protein
MMTPRKAREILSLQNAADSSSSYRFGGIGNAEEIP